MPEIDHRDERSLGEPTVSAAPHPGFRHVMACVDESPFARVVLEHAASIAKIVGAQLTIMRVLEPSKSSPADPVEWDLSRQKVQSELDQLAEEVTNLDQVDTTIVDGRAVECICQWAWEHDVDLTVLGTRGESDSAQQGMGGVVRCIIESIASSVMVVPMSERRASVGPLRYRRVMVPLDSSSQAESTLPIATRIAQSQGAELLLVLAVPGVDLISNGPLASEDIELCDRLRRRNERVAHRYLSRIHAMTPTDLRTRIRVLTGDEPRHALARAVTDEKADLLVLGCSGLGGHTDLPVGSTASFLIADAAIPVLLVRNRNGAGSATRRRTTRGGPPKRPLSQALS